MSTRLFSWLSARTPRERFILLGGALIVAALLIGSVWLPLQRGVGAADQRIAAKRAELQWLRSVAPQLSGLAAHPGATPPPHASLVVLVDRSARQAGLEHSLVRSRPSGNGGLNVRFEHARFDALVAWLEQVRSTYGLQVDSASIDNSGHTPGLVDATLVVRAH